MLLNCTDRIKLIRAIREAYKDINADKIPDVDIKNCVKAIKQFIYDIFEKGIKKPKQAKAYFEDFEMNSELKELIMDLDIHLSDEMVKEYVAKYTLYKNSVNLARLKESFDKSYDEFTKGNISDLDKAMHKLNEDVFNLYEVAREMSIANMDDNMSVIVPTDMSKSFGLEEKDAKIEDTSTSLVKTHMWIDNIVGGGFRGGRLYTVCSLL